MKKRMVALLLVILLLAAGLVPCSAEETTHAAAAQGMLEQLLKQRMEMGGTNDPQEWINGELTLRAGEDAEWYILLLSKRGAYDFASYEKALLQRIDGQSAGAVTMQKYALCLAAAGSTDGYISWVMNHTVGQLGLMSWVFALHMMNNGYESNAITSGQVLTTVLGAQQSDGGWATVGKQSDADATSMTVQALAPHAASNAAVADAVARAVAYLASAQTESGSFISYGVENAESVAQVLMALSSVGIDAMTDERFVKNGCTLLQVLETYRCKSGGMAHTAGAEFSENATAQVLTALEAYCSFLEGRSSFYLFASARPGDVQPEKTTSAPSLPDTSDETPKDTQEAPESGTSLRMLLCGGAALVGLIWCAVLFFVKKKKDRQSYLTVLLATAVAVGGLWIADIRLPQQVDDPARALAKENAVGSVTMSIRCDAVTEDGVVLEAISVSFAKGESLYDLLVQVTRAYGIHMEANGSGRTAYVEGINQLYEFDRGAESGWIYLVNGEQISVGCGAYEPANGDVIEWIYTVDGYEAQNAS